METYLYSDLNNVEKKHWWHITKRKAAKNLIQKYSSSNQIKILDVGCGTGENVREFSKLGKCWGIDISPEAIKFCKQKGLTNVSQTSIEKTNFDNKVFDIITILDVLEHVEEVSTFKEIRRILRNDGIVLITVPAFSWLWSKWDIVLHHKRRYSKNSLKKALESNGFEIIKISYMYSFLVIPALIFRSIKSLLYRNDYPSDFKLSSNFINLFFTKVVQLENLILNQFSIPIGTSIICVAKQKDD